MSATYQPLAHLSRRAASQIQVVFADIDDTISSDGKLQAKAYAALWKLHEAGIQIVPVTGRPAGWCDHIARFWPVTAVVGENGAFYFRYDAEKKKLQQRFLLSARERGQLAKKLARVRDRILAQVPGAALASDQPYRIHDLAIDFCEDVPRLDDAAIDRIVALFEAAGATAKVSSIHVNGWFGRYDKLGMMKLVAREVLDLDLAKPKARTRALFVGDSPNDEPGFGFFPVSVGVANVLELASRIRSAPAFVTRARGGAGFAELARALLASRRARK